MLTAPRPSRVSVRTRLLALKEPRKARSRMEPRGPIFWERRQASRTWPAICGSPSIMLSIPAATRYRWSTAAPSTRRHPYRLSKMLASTPRSLSRARSSVSAVSTTGHSR